jgi:hypothetical protein
VGGKGGYFKGVVNVTPGQDYIITIGIGGLAPNWTGNCPSSSQTDGGNGGNSSFSSLAIAYGGEGGKVNEVNGLDAIISNWQYSQSIPSSSVSYIPTGYVQNPPTNVASGGNGAKYCGYSFIACGPTNGENGYCIISY